MTKKGRKKDLGLLITHNNGQIGIKNHHCIEANLPDLAAKVENGAKKIKEEQTAKIVKINGPFKAFR